MNTLRPSEETWLAKEQMKTDIPEGWRSLDGLYSAAAAAAAADDDD